MAPRKKKTGKVVPPEHLVDYVEPFREAMRVAKENPVAGYHILHQDVLVPIEERYGVDPRTVLSKLKEMADGKEV